MVASAKLPTSIEPAEFKVTTPPVMVLLPTTHPPMEADTVVKRPVFVMDDEAFATVDVAPAIVAGRISWSTAKSPRTTKSLPSHSTYFD